MTWKEICTSDLLFLRAKDICGSVFPVSEKTLRKQAKQNAASLGFSVCIIGEQVFIPRKAFIAYVESFQPPLRAKEESEAQHQV